MHGQPWSLPWLAHAASWRGCCPCANALVQIGLKRGFRVSSWLGQAKETFSSCVGCCRPCVNVRFEEGPQGKLVAGAGQADHEAADCAAHWLGQRRGLYDFSLGAAAYAGLARARAFIVVFVCKKEKKTKKKTEKILDNQSDNL